MKAKLMEKKNNEKFKAVYEQKERDYKRLEEEYQKMMKS